MKNTYHNFKKVKENIKTPIIFLTNLQTAEGMSEIVAKNKILLFSPIRKLQF
jgi:hypothetical protein